MELSRVPGLAIIIAILFNVTVLSAFGSAERVLSNEEDTYPIFFFSMKNPSANDPLNSGLNNRKNFQQMFETLVGIGGNAESGKLDELEDLVHYRYAKPDDIAGNDDSDDEDNDSSINSRKREQSAERSEKNRVESREPYLWKSNSDNNELQPFTLDSKSSRSYGDKISFDDARYDSRRPSKPSSSIELANADESTNEDDEQEKPDGELSLLLGLGGYQRPNEEKPKEGKKLRPKLHDQIDDEESKSDEQSATGVDSASYDKESQSMQPQVSLPIQNADYGQALPNPFADPGSNYAAPQGNMQPYPGFGYNDYFSNTPTFDYNTALNEKLYSKYFNPYNGASMRGFFPQVPQTVQSSVLTAEGPFNQPTMRVSVPQPITSYQNTPYQPYAISPNPEERISQAMSLSRNALPNVAPFYERSAVPNANLYNQVPVRYANNWLPGNRLLIAQQPSFVPSIGLQSPQSSGAGNSGINGYYKNDEEQKLEAVSQKQPEKDLTERKVPQYINNHYLNYPTQNAGYGTVESLPGERGGSDTSPKELPVNVPELRPVDIQHRQLYDTIPSFGNNYPNSFLQLSTPAAMSENRTNNFDTTEYFKNLKLNYPFPPTPGDMDNALFFKSNERPNGNTPIYTFQVPPLSHMTDTINPNVKTNTGPNVLEFLSTGVPSNAGEDDAPSCASRSNTTMCFEDKEYPTADVMYAVDSDAVQLNRFLSPSSFQGSIDSYAIDGSLTAGDSEICQTERKHGHPLRAQDIYGKWKIIVNVEGTQRFEGFLQDVRVETCRIDAEPCSHTEKGVETRCVQKYSVNRLLAWSKSSGLHMSLFKIPIACVCQILKMEHSARK